MIEDFYTTPPNLIRKMLSGIRISSSMHILDIGAGKGDISDYIKSKCEYRIPVLDVIEINPDLQHILVGKNYNLIQDDFLTFHTFKSYDLMIGNLPFSCGDRLLKHALDLLEKNGGALRLLVNAETLRNPFSLLRREIQTKLENLHAEIEFLDDEFLYAERKTAVSTALIKVNYEKKNNCLNSVRCT